MSNAPYLLSKARSGYRLHDNGELIDSMIRDGFGRFIMIFTWVVVQKFVQGTLNLLENKLMNMQFNHIKSDSCKS